MTRCDSYLRAFGLKTSSFLDYSVRAYSFQVEIFPGNTPYYVILYRYKSKYAQATVISPQDFASTLREKKQCDLFFRFQQMS